MVDDTPRKWIWREFINIFLSIRQTFYYFKLVNCDFYTNFIVLIPMKVSQSLSQKQMTIKINKINKISYSNVEYISSLQTNNLER